MSYSGPVTGPVVVWAFENGQKVTEITLTNGPGPYSLQLLKNRNYDVKAFRDERVRRTRRSSHGSKSTRQRTRTWY